MRKPTDGARNLRAGHFFSRPAGGTMEDDQLPETD
jgi:hypothetical protein